MKEVTLKSKLAKTVQKEYLAKQYDDYVAKKDEVVSEQQSTTELKPQKPKKQVKRFDNSESETDETVESEEEQIIKKTKPKKKIKKKIVYESESDPEDEQIIVRKKKQVQKPPLEKLVYNLL